jgi:hypothetical protein
MYRIQIAPLVPAAVADPGWGPAAVADPGWGPA